ncbi:MAG: hypothetical protein BAJALOKI3v1_10042 [Promethearchaeota archaeon]|jgi:hypothetical protein|nr:MAG: hypothetical protein BAJALOKI3v1_10042 [Candidatus Lokiarchaeota archaeon]
MEYRKEPLRVYSLIYDLIVIGKHRHPVCIKETGRSGVLKRRILDLSKNFEGKVVEIECGTHYHRDKNTSTNIEKEGIPLLEERGIIVIS